VVKVGADARLAMHHQTLFRQKLNQQQLVFVRLGSCVFCRDGVHGECFTRLQALFQGARHTLEQLAALKKPKLIIIDPLFRLARIHDGNDYAEVYRALEPIVALTRETGAHLLCVHHAGKFDCEGGDSILGSTALFAAVDTAIFLRRTERYRTVRSMQRYGEDLPETVLPFDPQTGMVSLGQTREQDEEIRIAEAIVEHLTLQSEAEGERLLTQAELEEAIEGRTLHKRKALKALIDARKVKRIGKGSKGDPFRYCLKNS
jgi:AAA domain